MKENGGLLLFEIVVLMFSMVALFFAVNNYLWDQKQRDLIIGQLNVLSGIEIENRLNDYIQYIINARIALVQQLNQECNQLVTLLQQDAANLTNNTQTTYNLYIDINNTIVQQNQTCFDDIANLTQKLNWLLNAISSNATLVSSGICRLGNFTTNVNFNYKLLSLNGVDFYYYEFFNSTDVVDASYPFFIHGCSPQLFRGQPTVNKTVNFYEQTFTVQPLNISDYLSHIVVGNSELQFIPKTIPSINQTLGIVNFTFWLNNLF